MKMCCWLCHTLATIQLYGRPGKCSKQGALNGSQQSIFAHHAYKLHTICTHLFNHRVFFIDKSIFFLFSTFKIIFSCRKLSFNSTRSHLFSIFHFLKTCAESNNNQKTTQHRECFQKNFSQFFFFFWFCAHPKHSPNLHSQQQQNINYKLLPTANQIKTPDKLSLPRYVQIVYVQKYWTKSAFIFYINSGKYVFSSRKWRATSKWTKIPEWWKYKSNRIMDWTPVWT